MNRIIFLHGFFASGSCPLAQTLKAALEGESEVLSPDLPKRPKEALEFIRSLCERTRPDLLVGNSCGSFYAQMLAPAVDVPALLGNPHFEMTRFLRDRIGSHQYKSPRLDGNQELTIDEQLIDEFAELERHQFDSCTPSFRDKVWGIFGEKDPVAQYESVFLEHYDRVIHYPGAHTPTPEEIRSFHVPLIKEMLTTFILN
ncbi:MAG: hypothetical protein LUC24_00360 [Bacteroidales bacterium]|nr:hypothetical protein [Bacteroidales bacterium]